MIARLNYANGRVRRRDLGDQTPPAEITDRRGKRFRWVGDVYNGELVYREIEQ